MIQHDTLINLIDQRLNKLGISAREASLRAANNAEMVRSIRNGHSPSLKQLQKLLAVLDLNITLGEPDKNINSAPREIPLLGLVGAGARVAYFNDQLTPETVTLHDHSETNLAAAEVRGHSMEPVYHQGDLLFFCPDHERINDIAHFLGQDCIVVITEDHSALLKTIEFGSAPDLWNLRSHNPGEPTLCDQKISKAFPILWVKRHIAR